MTARFALEGPFWRRVARRAARGPAWFVRLAAPLAGLAVCAVAPGSRRIIRGNLRRVLGRRGLVREAVDVGRTFASFASCLADALGSAAGEAAPSRTVIRGELHLQAALAVGRGIVLVTAHTAGWEVVAPVLARGQGTTLTIVEAAERDPAAAEIQDAARLAPGVRVAHAGGDPVAAIALARRLRAGGVVGVQIDRAPGAVRARAVTLFGEPARLPEGPLRLAMLTGAPLLPAFVARTGFRRYEVRVRPPLSLDRAASDADLDRAAQHLASELEAFVRAHPTQWFHFRSE
jgi:KDO2-lipid IV(A) lauroyltransferase